MMNRKTMFMLVLLPALLGIGLFWRNNYNVDIQMIRSHKWLRISGLHRLHVLQNNYTFQFDAVQPTFRLSDAGEIYSLAPPMPTTYHFTSMFHYANCYVGEIVCKHHDYRHIYITIRDLNHDESIYISDY
jgi:hypothetical protein